MNLNLQEATSVSQTNKGPITDENTQCRSTPIIHPNLQPCVSIQRMLTIAMIKHPQSTMTSSRKVIATRATIREKEEQATNRDH